jgi:hypothetical protein
MGLCRPRRKLAEPTESRQPGPCGFRRVFGKLLLSANFHRLALGTPFAFGRGMSPIARALQERFDEVCRAELQRLRRKTAALSPEARAEVDAISVEVTQRIVARMQAALESDEGEGLADVVARLFAV